VSAPVRPSRAAGSRRAARRALLALPAALVLLPAASASADELVVTITPEGVQPQVLVARTGDTVRFVNEDRSFAYRAQSTGGPWSFDSGPTTLLTDDFAVPAPLTRPGTYAYRVAQDPPYRGTVLLGGGTPSAAAPEAVPSVSSPSPVPSATPPAPVPSASVGPAPVSGALPAPPSQRGLGLPTALAAVLVVGAGSLLVRLLLAESAASSPSGGRAAH